MTTYRKLGLHDRFSLSRTLIGFPPVVAIVSSFTLPNEAQSLDDEISKIQALLQGRITKLLEIIPALSTKVVDSNTEEPKWSSLDRKIASNEVLNLHTGIGEVGLQEILSKQLSLGMSLDPRQPPMWRVDVFQPNSKVYYIGLSVNHCVVDGKGCFNLFKLLVSPPFDLSNDLTQRQIEIIRGSSETSFPKASDVVFNMKPDWVTFLKVIFKALVIPQLPRFIRVSLEERQHWPYRIEKEIKDCQPNLILIQFKRKDFLKDLKENCIGFGSIKTIHSVIHSSIIVGILSLTSVENEDAIEGDGGRSEAAFDVIKSGTPINLRKEEHGLVAGNFISELEWTEEINGKDALFWEITKRYDSKLNSAEGRKQALSQFGMLAYIPDGPKDDATGEEPTGWETYLNSQKEFGESFSLSNLGKFSQEPQSTSQFTLPLLTELAWCQTPARVGAALSVDVCGLAEGQGENGGLSISFGFREGTLSERAIRKLTETVKSTLKDVSEGKVGKDAEVSELLRSRA